LTAIRYPHPRGPSKRYINLVIWSRPRVNKLSVLDLPLPFFLPPGFIFIFCCSFFGSVYWDFKLSSSIVTVLPASQVSLVFYQPLSSTTAVLLNFSGCGCLLPTQVQLQLYFLKVLRLICVLPIQDKQLVS
jgi:hypothetical protein